SNTFLAQEGANLLQAWLATGMAEPYVMAATSWGQPATPPPPVCDAPGTPSGLAATGGRRSVDLSWTAGALSDGSRVYYDQSGKVQFLAEVPAGTTTYKDNRLSRGTQYCYVVRAFSDCDGNGSYDVATDLESASTAVACATAQ
ncbi:MAG TPA: fibronectin type III domain-containing protein, partial [Steroidobacteraceae bacterium]|nr:fibronectin type III domain-containing protein [Steroidobacteraceae bacterium]